MVGYGLSLFMWVGGRLDNATGGLVNGLCWDAAVEVVARRRTMA